LSKEVGIIFEDAVIGFQSMIMKKIPGTLEDNQLLDNGAGANR